jgi:hypothetical protein
MSQIPHPENPFHMDNLKTIRLLEAQGFVGTDVSLAISLFEYGCIWREIPHELRDHPDEDYVFVFAVGQHREGAHCKFARVGMSSCDFASDTSWINDETWDSLLSAHGTTKAQWIDMSYPIRVTDLYRYFGYMNTFGSTIYGDAFTIIDPCSESAVEQFIEEQLDPDMVGSAEYLAVYELIEGCEDLEQAKGACEELCKVATEMLEKINNVIALQ